VPVILVGAIGGMVRHGIIGLFVGTVVLSIGYHIFTAWMGQEDA
jgi:predicted PurR-regulated permease PerM